jgi:hypothetical protein
LTPFDAYTVKARLAPALIALLPLGVVCYAWLPSFEQPWVMIVLAPCGIAALVVLALETRRAGLAVQDDLVRTWGGLPTTVLLRHGDRTIPAVDKARYHAILARKCPGLKMPSAADERHDVAGADSTYETAVNWLRAQTRDAKRFPLIADENGNYGFYRNMRGIRDLAFASSSVGVIGALALIWVTASLDGRAIAALVSSTACAAVVAVASTEGRVKDAAYGYAKALLGSIDGLTDSST